jgi:hypothetical protein
MAFIKREAVVGRVEGAVVITPHMRFAKARTDIAPSELSATATAVAKQREDAARDRFAATAVLFIEQAGTSSART